MAFNGLLIRIGNYEIDPDRFIAIKTYKFKNNYIDLNSTRVATGVLDRTVLDHIPISLTFTTPAMLTNQDVKELFDGIAANYLVPKEQKVLVTAYSPKTDSYETQQMYMVEPEFPIYLLGKDLVIYDPIQMEFVGY